MDYTFDSFIYDSQIYDGLILIIQPLPVPGFVDSTPVVSGNFWTDSTPTLPNTFWEDAVKKSITYDQIGVLYDELNLTYDGYYEPIIWSDANK